MIPICKPDVINTSINMCPGRRSVEKRRIPSRGWAGEFNQESFLRLSSQTFVSPKMQRADEGRGNFDIPAFILFYFRSSSF
jgi:hypothetical protein